MTERPPPGASRYCTGWKPHKHHARRPNVFGLKSGKLPETTEYQERESDIRTETCSRRRSGRLNGGHVTQKDSQKHYTRFISCVWRRSDSLRPGNGFLVSSRTRINKPASSWSRAPKQENSRQPETAHQSQEENTESHTLTWSYC